MLLKRFQAEFDKCSFVAKTGFVSATQQTRLILREQLSLICTCVVVKSNALWFSVEEAAHR